MQTLVCFPDVLFPSNEQTTLLPTGMGSPSLRGTLWRIKHPTVNGNKFYAVTKAIDLGNGKQLLYLRRLRQKDGVGLEHATTVAKDGVSARFDLVDLSTLTKAQMLHFAGWLALHGGA